eukprot:8181022-Pyramimonas_sp.AAC.1
MILAKGPTISSCECREASEKKDGDEQRGGLGRMSWRSRRLASSAFDKAPFAATVLEMSVPKWAGERMRTLPLRPS